jgi:sugar phosphate isomerase/epimerase
MKLGAYTACLHDKPLAEALRSLRARPGECGDQLRRVPAPGHLPIDDLRSSEQARQDYLGVFDAAGVTLTALNCNGNPLDPHPTVGPRTPRTSSTRSRSPPARREAGGHHVGPPGRERRAAPAAWNVLPWHSVFLDVRDYQWNEVAIPFWKDRCRRAPPTPT